MWWRSTTPRMLHRTVLDDFPSALPKTLVRFPKWCSVSQSSNWIDIDFKIILPFSKLWYVPQNLSWLPKPEAISENSRRIPKTSRRWAKTMLLLPNVQGNIEKMGHNANRYNWESSILGPGDVLPGISHKYLALILRRFCATYLFEVCGELMDQGVFAQLQASYQLNLRSPA